MQSSLTSLRPAEHVEDINEANSILKIHEMIYDRLVDANRDGRIVPKTATSWSADPRWRQWRFHLRPGVKWQDGTAMTREDWLASFEGVAPGASVQASDDSLSIELGAPFPALLEHLATSSTTLITRPAAEAAGAQPVGTGPFRLSEWEPGRRARLEANQDVGPYLDKIEIVMGRSSREQLLDLESDRADVTQLDPAEARRAQQENRRIWLSSPLELLYLTFALNKPPVQDIRVREALAQSVDRETIQKVLSQGYGEATASIFPRWLSGYAFLFPTARNIDRARQLTTEIGTPPTIKLGFEASDSLARQTAERIAVNARDAGLTVQASALPQGWQRMPDTGMDVRVQRARLAVPTLNAALVEAGSQLNFWLADPGHMPERLYTAEDIFQAEQKFLADFHVVPLLYLPEIVGLGSRVENWQPTPLGEWHLENVSLGLEIR